MKKQSLTILLCLTLFTSLAFAGYDSASVPENRIPWSGYWWPKTSGKLVLGYSGTNKHPSPLEKYDAYVDGFFPGTATAKGLEKEYNPDAVVWAGHCDNWAAAAVLEPEPDHPGDLMGIHFRVGDKKGLLTLHYKNNYEVAVYGERYDEEPDKDPNDIYPGGVSGFHQTLINYISLQGLPIIMDMDYDLQIWNYPIYKYEMEWYDQGNKRHVTCKVWLADNSVVPDFTGTSPFTKIYTYWLETDGNGEITDAPGGWEGDSVNDHPDFLWFPFFLGNSMFLDNETVSEIVTSELQNSDDRFEENDNPEQAHSFDILQKNRFYCANSKDEDWYRVALRKGDDFTVNALCEGSLNIRILNSAYEQIGSVSVNGASLDKAPETGIYYVKVYPALTDDSHYSIEFYQSPMALIPHTPFVDGWDTTVTILNIEEHDQNIRLNLFDRQGKQVAEEEFLLPAKNSETISFDALFSQHASVGSTAKIINLDGQTYPHGFFSYKQEGGLANIPLDDKKSDILYIPHIAVSGGWWTGTVIANPDPVKTVHINMRAYSFQGEILDEEAFEIGPGQNKVDLIQNYWEEPMPEKTAWIEFSADGLMQGCVLWGNSNDITNPGLAGVPLIRPEQAANTLYFPHLPTTQEWWTGIVLLNPGLENSRLTLKGYSEEGVLIQNAEKYIMSKGNWIGFIQDLFSVWDDSVAWAEITADHPVTGLQLFGRESGYLAATFFPTLHDTVTDLWVMNRIPDMDMLWTGLVFVNPFGIKSDIWADPHDLDGNRLLDDNKYLWYNPPHGIGIQNKAVDVLEELFPGLPSDATFLQIKSEEPLLKLGIYGDTSEKNIDALPIDQPN